MITKQEVLEQLYNIKEKLTPEFKLILSTLLGQEWTSPSPTLINVDQSGIIWINLHGDSFPVNQICYKSDFIAAIEELYNKEVINRSVADYIISEIEKLPKKFEVEVDFA